MHQYTAGYGAVRTNGSASDQGTTVGYGATPGYGGAVGYGTAPVVSFQNVSKHYGSLRAVDGLSLDLRPGETVALLGPDGAGKSTSLDMLLALRKPTSGKIQMFGSDPYHAVKSGRVGAMLQSGGLMPEVTVRELVTLVTGLHPKPEPVDVTLKRAGIAEFADQRVDRLSGGQTQRVRFALAICGKSELIVLDEPTAAMDVETRRLFWNSMKEEVADGRTLLFATHYLEEADQAADRILVINRGRLLAGSGAADQPRAVLLLRHPRRSVVPDDRLPAEGRRAHTHLRRGEDRQRCHREHRRVGGPGPRPGDMARDLPRAGHRLGPRHRGDGVR
jgi:ABC-2 type transport system ATP-binding protein